MMTRPPPGSTLFATQLSRHPGLQRLPLETMYARHPAQTDHEGRRFVPAVYQGPAGPSLFLYPFNRYSYQDRMLPDGRTIEYHPSSNGRTNGQLRSLVGKEVTLYAQVGRREARQARVVVEHPPDLAEDVFHLRLVTAAPSAAAAPAPQQQQQQRRVLWADME